MSILKNQPISKIHQTLFKKKIFFKVDKLNITLIISALDRQIIYIKYSRSLLAQTLHANRIVLHNNPIIHNNMCILY